MTYGGHPPSSSVEREPPSATVTDHRPVPRGVLPRGVQTWVMAGVAVGMLAIMLIVGRPDPPARPATTDSARAGAERRPRARLSGPLASARGAGAARRPSDRAGAERVSRIRTTTPSLLRRKIRSRPIESDVNTRACLPATSS